MIRGTEPGTFARLVYHNTRPLTVNRPSATFRPGGILLTTVCAWGGCAIFGASVWWYPLFFVAVLAALLLADTLTGIYNTLLELKVLDSLPSGGHRDHGCETCDEEDEQGEEGAGEPVG